MTDTVYETRALLAACRVLFGRALDITRSAASTAPSLDQVNSARRCVDLALLSLQGEEVATLLTSPISHASTAASVAERLLSNLSTEDGGWAPTAEPEPRSLPKEEVDGFCGSTDAIELPDLLGFLQVQRKTGVLEVRLEQENITLEFLNGELMSACSDNAPVGSRLGEILIERGMIEKERLGSFLIVHSRSSGKLGRALETEELVTKDQLRAALELQVQQIFQRMFSAERSTFRLLPREDREDCESDGDLRMNVIQLLLESACANDTTVKSRPRD